MKSVFLSLFFSLFLGSGYGQSSSDFAPIGATWHYEEIFAFSPK